VYDTREDYRSAWQDAYEQDPTIPLNIDIELASVCNLACPFCLHGESEWAKSITDKSKRNNAQRLMPTKMALAIIREAADIGVPALKFNFRGESTLHPDFSDIMLYAKPYKFHDLLINTNANCEDKALEGLMAATKCMVSLDSMTDSIYPKIRIGGSLDRAKEVVHELIRQGHPNLWVRRVICQENKDENFVELVKEEFGDKVKVSEHFAFDRSKESVQAVHDGHIESWERIYCGYPSQRLIITASGDYLPCCLHWSDEYVMGNWDTSRIQTVWYGQEREGLVKNLRENKQKNM